MTWTARAGWAVPAAVVSVLLLGGITALTGVVVPGIVGVVVALAFLHFRWVRVTVDDTHLRTRFSWPGLLRVDLPLAEIERLEHVPDLRPVRYGGWGYRGSLRLLKKAAVILRRGDGVIFALTRNRRYIITIDDAASLARTVQERIGR
jgi:hypothetical protein